MDEAGKPRQHPDYVKAPLNRRAFLRRALTATGLGAVTGYLALAPENWPLSRRDDTGRRSQPKITPLRLRDFRVAKPAAVSHDLGIGRGGDIARKLRQALGALGGLPHYVKPGDIVLVKPNVAFDRSPALGATSNPELITALIRMLLADCRAQEVRVADNPIESPADCFAKSGIRQATEAAGGRVYLPDGNAFKMLHTPGATLIGNWPFFHRPFTNVDKVIGVAAVKDHNLCGASLGMKNWYGLLGGARNQFHQDIHEVISDLSLLLKPTLTILDGTRVLMRNGPTGGNPADVKEGDAVLAGLDPVALDAWAYEHLLERGRDYPQYLRLAEAKGSGKVDYAGRVKESA